MANLVLNIDNFIGNYGYSKQWVSNMLKGHEKDEVIVNISSRGGDVDHALSIHDQFVKHGNVTAVLSGFVASAATLIAMGAKKVIMSQNAFFLIHKALNWIDVFDRMNEDDIDNLIEELTKTRNNLAKITLQIAKIYAVQTGQTVQQILNLMKKEEWLNAEETLENGFANEIDVIQAPVNLLEDSNMVALLSADGLPLPVRANVNGKKSPEHENSNPETMIKNLTYINTLLNIDGFESDQEGVYLNLSQLQIINDRIMNHSNENSRLLAANETQTASITQLTSERDAHAATITDLNSTVSALTAERDTAVSDRDAAVSERDAAVSNLETAKNEAETAKTSLNQFTEAFNAIDESIANAQSPKDKAAAIRAILSAKPGTTPVGTLKNDEITPENSVIDWKTIDNLPHNQGVK